MQCRKNWTVLHLVDIVQCLEDWMGCSQTSLAAIESHQTGASGCSCTGGTLTRDTNPKNITNQSVQTSLLTVTDSQRWSSGSEGPRTYGSVQRRPAGECGGRQWAPLCWSVALMDAATGPQLCLCILHTRCQAPSHTSSTF